MVFFSSRREFAVWVALSVYILHIFSFNPWSVFFQNLQHSNQSYRLMQIWVQADSPKRPLITPIGASEDDYVRWQKGIDRLLYQSLRYPDVKFHYSFIADEKTLYKNNEVFAQWQLKYPKNFSAQLYSDWLGLYPHLQDVNAQCENGIAAACSDVLRLVALYDPDFDYNVYMDIDTFIHRKKLSLNPYLPYSPFSRSSDELFGLSLKTAGLAQSSYSYVGQSLDKSALQINNDFLIAYQPPAWLWSFIQNIGFARLEPANPFFTILTERVNITSLEEYQKHLEKKVNFALTHPQNNINSVPLVINTVGPGFWKDLYIRGLSHAYPLPIIPSSGGWMNHSGKVYGVTSVEELRLFISDDLSLHTMLELNFLSHDYFYFKQRGVLWLSDLQALIAAKRQESSPEDFHTAKNFFQSSFSWLEEICYE